MGNFKIFLASIWIIVPRILYGEMLGGHVCYESYTERQKYTSNCGLFGWDRCTRYRTIYMQTSFCCEGWDDLDTKYCVYRGPSTASITGNAPVFADGSNSLTLTCVADSDVVTYEWRLRGAVIAGARTNTLTLSPVEPSHNGASVKCTVRCTFDSTHATSNPIILTVYYPPDVTVSYGTDGDTGVTFTCQASGIPQTYNFRPWKHIAPDRETVIRELHGDQNNDLYTLILNNVTYEDNGYYECTVNNGVQGRSTQVDQTKLSDYILEGPPIILEKDDSVHNELGGAINIAVSFYSVPEYTSVEWNGMMGNLSNTVNATSINTTFHGKTVILAGYVTILELVNVTADDFISYRVVVNNTRGSASFVKTLTGITVPCTPENGTFTAEAINKHTIEISWTGGCNGGAEQTFYIEYKKSSKEEWTLAHEITENQNGGDYSVLISDLDQGTQYDIRIWAKNAKGQSDYIYLLSETEHQTSDAQISPVVVAAVGTPVAMLVLGAVIVLLLWRRGTISFNKLASLCKQANEPEGTFQNHAFDPKDESYSNGAYESLQITTEKLDYEKLQNVTPRNKDLPKTEDDVVYVNTTLNL